MVAVDFPAGVRLPVYILLLIAVVPVLAMVATAGNALGRDAQLAAVIALTIILSALVAWLVAGSVRTVLGLLDGFSGRFGGYGYGFGHGGISALGAILIIVVVLLLTGRL